MREASRELAQLEKDATENGRGLHETGKRTRKRPGRYANGNINGGPESEVEEYKETQNENNLHEYDDDDDDEEYMH